MKHQQILDKLAARFLVQALDENFAYATSQGMLAKGFTPQVEARVWEQVFNRWNCVLQENNPDKIHPLYRYKTLLAMAIIAHRYGLNIDAIRQEALDAIDALNEQVALSDDFFRHSPKIKEFLHTLPNPPKRRPPMPDNITFLRPQDVVSIQHKQRFFAAYVHKDTGINENPIIEFYDVVFEHEPTWYEVQNLPAKGASYQDGTTRIQHYAISQMKYLPDPANQVKLIASAIATPPKSEHLTPAVGLYMMSSIFQLQNDIEMLFQAA